MRFLITSTNNVPNYGWGQALKELGHEVYMWEMQTKPAFDIFDEFQPDFVIAEAKQINRSLFKCLLANASKLKKVLLWLGGWTAIPQYDWICKDIIASDAERETVLYLKDKIPLLGLAYTSNDFACNSHFMWEHEGKIDYISTKPACALAEGEFKEELACDILYYGPRTPRALEFIPKICTMEYNVKVFSDEVTDWGLAQYLGRLSPTEKANAFASAKVSLAMLSRSDYIPDETPYNILGAGGSCVSTESAWIKQSLDLCDEITTIYKPQDIWFPVEHHAHYKRYGVPIIKSDHRYIHRVKKALKGLI